MADWYAWDVSFSCRPGDVTVSLPITKRSRVYGNAYQRHLRSLLILNQETKRLDGVWSTVQNTKFDAISKLSSTARSVRFRSAIWLKWITNNVSLLWERTEAARSKYWISRCRPRSSEYITLDCRTPRVSSERGDHQHKLDGVFRRRLRVMDSAKRLV